MILLESLIEEQWPGYVEAPGTNHVYLDNRARCDVSKRRIELNGEVVEAAGIGRVFVRPECRNNGVGSQLIHSALQVCLDLPVIAFVRPELASIYIDWIILGKQDGKLLLGYNIPPGSLVMTKGGETW